MAFDQSTRSRLQRFVNEARKGLEEEFTRQLQHDYGLDPGTGIVTPLINLRHLNDAQRETARILRDTLAHYRASGEPSDKSCLDRIVREQAFTVLNRLAALRMAEARGLLIESVGNGYQAKGFQLYARLAGTGLGETGDAYRAYLFSIFDELGQDLPGLFDRFSPQGRLFPRESALLPLLALINAAEIEPLWAQDETIGWIYQYFNSKDERKAMRDASQAPRNSRELAVRNQFFTPRYVVEFLVDNTLGRLWYELTQGQTTLRDRCTYLLCQADDIFLGRLATESSPGNAVAQALLHGAFDRLPAFESEAENIQLGIQLAQCVDAYHRHPHTWAELFSTLAPLLREQRYDGLTTQQILEGLFMACRADRHGGQGDVYREPWFLATCREIVRRLRYPEGSFKSQVINYRAMRDPRTIKLLDPACGSMHFGLYAFDLFLEIYHEAWTWEQDHGAGSLDVSSQPAANLRPLSETYKDEAAYLRDVPRLILEHNIYGVDIDPRAAQIASLALWLRAQRAWHEAEVIAAERPLLGRGNVVAAIAPPTEPFLRKQVMDRLDQQDALLFERTLALLEDLPELGLLLRVERDLPRMVREVFGEDLGPLLAPLSQSKWKLAEVRLLEALTNFSEATQVSYQGRLFTQDALQGLRLIDLSQQVFDIVVMNPPFGDSSEKTKKYFEDNYGNSKSNLLCGFLVRAHDLLRTGGYIGAIYDRTVIVKSNYEKFRREFILEKNRLVSQLDLGWNVLDANVEVTSSVIQKQGSAQGETYFLNARGQDAELKGSYTLQQIGRLKAGEETEISAFEAKMFLKFPNAVLGYDFPDFALKLFSKFDALGSSGVRVIQGHTIKSFRFFRSWWEVPADQAFFDSAPWQRFYNGGEYCRFIHRLTDAVLYGKRGELILDDSTTIFRNTESQQKGGLGFGKRGDFIDAHLLPEGFVSSVEGQAVIIEESVDPYSVLAFFNSRLFQVLINLYCGQHKYPGYVHLLPSPKWKEHDATSAGEIAEKIYSIKFAFESCDEISPFFFDGRSRAFWKPEFIDEIVQAREEVEKLENELEQCVHRAFSLSETESQQVYDLSAAQPRSGGALYQNPEVFWAENLFHFVLGCAAGRWELNAVHQFSNGAGEIDNFSPLPILPPAMLSLPESTEESGEPYGGGYLEKIIKPSVFVSDSSSKHDITHRIAHFIEEIFESESNSVEHKLCSILKCASLRDYLDSTSGFFASHLKKYSKSREAPIYWPLSTASGTYTIWIYYTNLNDQTLYIAVNDFVEPKLKQVRSDLIPLRTKGTGRSREDEKQMEALQTLELELIELQDTLLRIAPTYRPNHNDGVQITAAPLWPLFRHKPWQKVLKDTWTKLEDGEYDWAHLALAYWPARVREKCKTDKSLAIAHKLESLYVEPAAKPAKTRGKKPKEG